MGSLIEIFFTFSAEGGHLLLSLFVKHIIDHYPQCTKLLHSTVMTMALYQFIMPVHSGVIQLVTFLIDVMKCDITTEDNKVG